MKDRLEEFINKNGEKGKLNAWLSIPKGAYEGELECEVSFSLFLVN